MCVCANTDLRPICYAGGDQKGEQGAALPASGAAADQNQPREVVGAAAGSAGKNDCQLTAAQGRAYNLPHAAISMHNACRIQNCWQMSWLLSFM